jgi:hypothetical protein
MILSIIMYTFKKAGALFAKTAPAPGKDLFDYRGSRGSLPLVAEGNKK